MKRNIKKRTKQWKELSPEKHQGKNNTVIGQPPWKETSRKEQYSGKKLNKVKQERKRKG